VTFRSFLRSLPFSSLDVRVMFSYRFYCSILFIISVNTYPINKTPGYPVVLSEPLIDEHFSVPGDGGSRIEAKLTGKPQVVHYICSKKTVDFFDLWLNLELFAPLVIDCWVDNMKLVYNASDGTTSNKPGVETRIPSFGSTESLEWLDPSKSSTGIYFSTLVEAMVTWGYRRGKDIVGAPFDWRRAPSRSIVLSYCSNVIGSDEMTDYYRALQLLIESTYRLNGNTKVVILAHSMGNPMMLYFYNSIVNKQWKEKFIRSHISLAGAWGGAMQIVRLYAAGNLLI
jgi:lysophospholipase-3